MTHKLWSAALLIALAAPAARNAAAQGDAARVPLALPVHGPAENHLRTLQLLDTALAHPWSVRGFSPAEIRHLVPAGGGVPGSRQLLESRPVRTDGRARLEVVPAAAALWYNSSFPFGTNDGPVWRGRGFTALVRGGVAAAYGPVSLVLAPTMFVAENRAFDLMATGLSGSGIYADPSRPLTVDRPQRFGDAAYAAFDPGESTLRIDAGRLTLGLSTANMWWGPMAEYPYILGNNAAGFRHLFLGSAMPLNVGIGRLHGRLIYGYLDQSAYGVDTGLAARRFASGLVGVFTPRGAPGLEIGGARFFHTPAREGGPTWRDYRKPLEGLLKSQVTTGGDAIPGDNATDRDNQLASIFFRWVLPRTGLEVYGEYGREDHNGSARDVLLEPDHSASYGLGFARAWREKEGFVTVRGEVMNMDPSLLQRGRPQGATYTHTFMLQGHTQRGQLLGAGFATFWGTASTLSAERFRSGVRSTVELSRAVVRERDARTGMPDPVLEDQDVQYALTVRRARPRGRGEVGWELTGVYEMNRDLLRRDAFALNAGVHVGWW